MKQWQAGRLEGLFSSKKREYALVILFFFLLAILFTWPLILHPHNGILGGRGDPLLNSWIISWDAKTMFTNPTGLFQGNIIYPSRDVLAYSEHQFTLGLIAAPVYYIFRNPILAYNFVVFFSFVFAAFGCYLLIKELTGSRWGGLVAGAFFAFLPYLIAQLSHIQIFFSPFLPFMLLYLYRYLDKGRWRNLVLFGVFFVAQSLASWHYLMYSALAAGLLWLWAAAFSRRKEEWIRLAWVVVAVIVAALIILPFALPYFRAHSRLPGFEREKSEVELYGAEGEDFLRVLDVNVVYGDAPEPFKEGGIGYEDVLYTGIFILVLALAGIFLRRREGEDFAAFDRISYKKGVIYALILGIFSLLLCFGPKIGGWDNPFYMIPYNLGLLRFSRVPTRFFVLVGLSLAMLGGYGAAKLSIRSTSSGEGGKWLGRLTGAALLLILLLELFTFNLYITDIPVYGDVPEVYDWLSEQEEVQVIELPTTPLGGAVIYDRDLEYKPLDIFEHLFRESDIIYYSTYHWKDIVNGYSGYSPFFYRRILTEMQSFPSQRSLELLQGLSIDYIIWDWEWVAPNRQEEYNIRLFDAPGLSFVGDFENKSVFRVEPGETATIADLSVREVAPEAVPPGKGFDPGLYVSNSSDEPFVLAEEEPQPFTLRFIDKTGAVVLEEKGDYRAPFFVQGGETISIPLRVEEVPGVGMYAVELVLEEGVLGPQEFTFEMEIAEMPDSTDPDVLDGSILLRVDTQVLQVPFPDGLYPLMEVTVENSGNTLWRAAAGDDLDSTVPGSVHLSLRWEEEDGALWEDQGCSLPCDVSPGQSVLVPMLVRPPAGVGRFRLFLGLYHEGTGLFGELIELEVEVEGGTELLEIQEL
jgi:hypothetical protein